jgi:predicted Zn-dependent protease
MNSPVKGRPARTAIWFISTLLLLLASILTPARLPASELPDLGDPSGAVLSPQEDYRLGQAFMRNLRQNVKIIEDPELNAYINSLGYRLLAAANTDQPFDFFIVDDPNINAFAGPGGHIGIHSGLILAAKSEGELAAVMAHEIAHVTQHHLARAFEKASSTQLQTAAAILAAILLGSPELSTAMITTAAAGNIQQQLNFTRSNEREADRVGIDILANSGFDPHDMPDFFERLEEAYRYMQSNLPELLRTHPVTPNRIADSENRADQYAGAKDQTSDSFPYIQAKLRALDEQEHRNRLKEIEAKLADSQSLSDVERYEYALFQLQLGNLDKALTESTALLKKSPEAVQFIALQASIELAMGRHEAALAGLQKALLLFPHHPQLSVLYARALLQAGKPEQAADTMRELIQKPNQFILSSYYQLLAKAESAAGHQSNAYMALANYYYMIGQTRTAIDQLETALDHSAGESDFQTERIKAQLAILKRSALEEQGKETAGEKGDKDEKKFN